LRKVGAHEIAAASVLGAISALCEVIPGPPFDVAFPLLPRISWDITGLPMMVSLLLYGPLCALYTSVIGCSIIFMRGNIYGGTFKIIAELATLMGFSLFRKNFVVDAFKATASRMFVMTVVNYYLLQLFYGIPEKVVLGLLGPIAIFNVTQALINIVPAYVIYLRVKKASRQSELA